MMKEKSQSTTAENKSKQTIYDKTGDDDKKHMIYNTMHVLQNMRVGKHYQKDNKIQHNNKTQNANHNIASKKYLELLKLEFSKTLNYYNGSVLSYYSML